MANEQWGFGSLAGKKAFDTVKMGDEVLELFHGDHPHSRQDNNTYAKTKAGAVYDFSGHRMPFRIEIEEHNYLKTSGLSGDEIRKGGSVKLYCRDIQCFEAFARTYESGFRQVQRFIIDMEENWSWFPHNADSEIGRIVGYREQLFKIKRIIVSRAVLNLETLDGLPVKRFLFEDPEEHEPVTSVHVSLTDECLTWFPKQSI